MSQTVLSIKTPVRIYHTREYASRLLLVNNQLNPRDEIGKLGITYHHPLTAFNLWAIKVNVSVLDEKNQAHEQVMHINRKSLRKYLKATLKNDVDIESATDEELISRLNDTSWEQHQDNSKKATFQGEQGLRHAGRHNRLHLSGWMITLWTNTLGRFFSWLYLKTVDGINRMHARLLFLNRERSYFEISEKMAILRHNEAKDNVPAYQKHLQQHAFQLNDTTTLLDVPVTTKDGYIKPNAQNYWETHKKGKLPSGQYKIDTSTGTTEAPTVWVRSEEEILTVQNSMRSAWDMIMGDRKPLIINAFALGPWATGLSVHEIARNMGATASIGADVLKIFQTIDDRYRYEQDLLSKGLNQFITKYQLCKQEDANDMVQELMDVSNKILYGLIEDPELGIDAAIDTHLDFKKYPYLKKCKSGFRQLIEEINGEKMLIAITGYPPFLLAFADFVASKGIDFAKYHVSCGAGGQAIGEPMRRAMENKGYLQVTSSYGASDLDINVGLETKNEVLIRRAIEGNPAMARELYGPNVGVPMVFRYDPLNYHIECSDKDNHLVFTCTRENRSSPRVRYDIKDTGRVYAASDVYGMLRKYGLFSPKMDEKLNLPFLFIWGRDSTAGYGTCNVPFDELESALETVGNPSVLKQALYKYERDLIARFDVFIELNEQCAFFNIDEQQQFHAHLIQAMAEKNEYFAEEINRLGNNDEIPAIHFYKRNTSPIAEPGGQRKQVLVFDSKPSCNDEDCKVARLTKEEYLAICAHAKSTSTLGV